MEHNIRRSHLLPLIQDAVAKGPVTLSSGRISDFYIDARLVTLNPIGSKLIGRLVLDVLTEWQHNALAGPTTAACPIVSAAGVIAAQHARDIKLAYVRKEAKGYGMGKSIEGPPLGPADKVLMVDDVLTTGGSLLKAIREVRNTGAHVSRAFVLVDRQEGGRDALLREGIEVSSFTNREQLKAAIDG